MEGKNIIVGVTGGIAAYKTASLVRELKKRGANVRVVMTPLAKQFITPLTMATLSQNPIMVDFFNPENGEWNSHVSLGIWADAYVIAPATANSIGKMANGIADNLLLTTYLSAKCPVFIAPAMDLDMYAHPAVQKNIALLKERGNFIIDAEEGFLASGLSGKGRMAEPETIAQFIEQYFNQNEELSGKKVMITAGPTYEKIDPVRFIGNYSSGKMGYALAEECAAGCVLFTEDEAYARGLVVFRETDARAYVKFLLDRAQNDSSLFLKGSLSAEIRLFDDEKGYDGLIAYRVRQQRPCSVAVLSWNGPDLFRLPFLSLKRASRTAVYEWVD